MKIITPNYYRKFKCTAEYCKNSCCVGWEIDIDEDTLQYYNSLDSEFGKRLRENIGVKDNIASFKLDEKERCPFLNNKGLCEIIINCGEEALCDICTEHPRFKNFFEARIEIGLGLCCEAAAELILADNESVEFLSNGEETYNEHEEKFFEIRENIYNLLQNKSLTLVDRIRRTLKNFDLRADFLEGNRYLKEFEPLECLNSGWKQLLSGLENVTAQDIKNVLNGKFTYNFERLAIYFVFRHLWDGYCEEKTKETLGFIIKSLAVIAGICAYEEKLNGLTLNFILDISRRFSCEVEYSDQNVALLREQALI